MSPAALLAAAWVLGANPPAPDAASVQPPRGVVLVMADDLGFAQVGYPIGLRDEPHPVLQTPHLNAMAANGLRLDGFRSAAFTCSPTRASVLTGRTNDRTGVLEHGYPLNPNEITLAQLLRDAGYATGHFGKWHLDGFRGPGVPILEDDPLSPGNFGFETWLSVTNFFDHDPLMSRGGAIEQFAGDSSEVIVAEALTFIRQRAAAEEPFFAVVWYGSPHSPFVASDEDAAPFADLEKSSQNHHAEIAAMDRSVGALRAGLREAGFAENTLLWFCSDNGGLPRIEPSPVAPLRGNKGTIYEGGLRVPAIVEWPAAIEPGRVSEALTVTSDILPTVCAAVGVAPPERPLDGVNLLPLLSGAAPEWQRPSPLGFRQMGSVAWVDGDWKLLASRRNQPANRGRRWELYDLANDPTESRDLAAERPADVSRLAEAFERWSAEVDASAAGRDYGPDAIPATAEPRQWAASPEYAPFLDEWRSRPEYRGTIERYARPTR
ncbi:sulfatase family protein [Alienimonas californiensis]|uniref:Arylsulfatase n=1 Tax=Alienimonas californiensis TaxID=2527989 RepID=A0A517PAP0_9PLAN|nr:sulfatase-like hydrolase/transferase [Alienimonas californiensis]QDT16421.1 Arylsulfatase precursor [Alienimonas californiensis]